ncbi:PREDICTED: zinc finger protein ZAT11-like [Tarenaya hassleriana]|uniref:zinc finger protein ZAT11-like n=1 Tax=Tarenaya hassleriana TaxID=28532 RepID=UPI00053C0FDD|nr:PREDICTED: zinc finger protein ZAT11-like [Tarenaya hassleriana]
MKRERSDYENSIKSLDIAKYLILLSETFANTPMVTNQSVNEDTNHFECKTCNKRFSSFQALGGHRASHKKPKLVGEPKHNNGADNDKTHECSICRQSFGSGQALGGHMRRHRAVISAEPVILCPKLPAVLPVLKRCNSSKRVLSLDLNLTPLENDLEYVLGNTYLSPKIDMNFVS